MAKVVGMVDFAAREQALERAAEEANIQNITFEMQEEERLMEERMRKKKEMFKKRARKPLKASLFDIANA